MNKMNVYRPGGPTHTRWLADIAEVNRVITECDALIRDPEDEWVGVDPDKLPGGLAEHCAALTQLGYWHGWIAA